MTTPQTTGQQLARANKARVALILDQPFFGSLALRMPLEETTTIATACTDGSRIQFNPAFIAPLTDDQVKSLIAHEVMHIALKHNRRRDAREPETWNDACDYAINAELDSAGFATIDGGLLDPALAGMSSEAIYSELMSRKPPAPPPQPEEETNPNPDDQGEPDPDGAPQQGEGDEDGESDSDGTGQGSGEPPPASSPGEVEDAPDADTPQVDDVAIRQAVQAGIQAGKLPASMARMILSQLEPRQDWRDLLRRFITTRAKNDYSYTRPNRRYIASGLYLPGAYSEELGDLVIAIDTSGSISQGTLDTFAGELNGIRQSFPKTQTRIIYCDAEINSEETYEPTDDVTLTMQGGGGTRYAPVFAHLEAEPGEKPPACIVYLTDGYCDDFGIEPEGVPVLWALLCGRMNRAHFAPPFGEVIDDSND